MKKRIQLAGLLVLFLCPAVQAAHNTTVHYDNINNPNSVTSIDDLAVDLDGTGTLSLFDVVFQFLDGQDIPITDPEACGLGNPCDVFVFDPLGEVHAQATAGAISDVLNSVGATAVGFGISPPATGINQFYVPYEFSGPSNCEDVCTYSGWNPSGAWFPIFAEVDMTGQVELARLTPVVHTPIPPAVFLFASGLALLGIFKRRRSGA